MAVVILKTRNAMAPYVPPSQRGQAYNCPQCHAFSTQIWGNILHLLGNSNQGPIDGMALCTCAHCNGISIWHDTKMVYPMASTAPPANADLPSDIAEDYNEARNVLPISPRGAAALLRLCIQKLCAHLGEKGKNINDDIKSLVAKGLPPQIQQSLDIVRVVGNNAVHPGQLDLQDDHEMATKLFGLINIIVEVMITQPKHVQAMYNAVVPSSQQVAIQIRDTK